MAPRRNARLRLFAFAAATIIPAVGVAILTRSNCVDCRGIEGGVPQRVWLSVLDVGDNWSVILTTVLLETFPDTTYLEIRDQNGATRLACTSFSRLTPAHWDSFHVRYEKANPSIRELEVGDRFLIDGLRYQHGSRLSIQLSVRPGANVIGSAVLQ